MLGEGQGKREVIKSQETIGGHWGEGEKFMNSRDPSPTLQQ